MQKLCSSAPIQGFLFDSCPVFPWDWAGWANYSFFSYSRPQINLEGFSWILYYYLRCLHLTLLHYLHIWLCFFVGICLGCDFFYFFYFKKKAACDIFIQFCYIKPSTTWPWNFWCVLTDYLVSVSDWKFWRNVLK